MRKRLIDSTPESIRTRGEGWLDIESAAVVKVTSEDKDFPVELAFGPEDAPGWRAAAPGIQTIRLIFDQPQRLRCISLVFEENETGALKSLFCGGLRTVGVLLKRLCASSGISAHLDRYVKSKNITCSFQTLRCRIGH